MSQWCDVTAKKTNEILGCTNKGGGDGAAFSSGIVYSRHSEQRRVAKMDSKIRLSGKWWEYLGYCYLASFWGIGGNFQDLGSPVWSLELDYLIETPIQPLPSFSLPASNVLNTSHEISKLILTTTL